MSCETRTYVVTCIRDCFEQLTSAPYVEYPARGRSSIKWATVSSSCGRVFPLLFQWGSVGEGQQGRGRGIRNTPLAEDGAPVSLTTTACSWEVVPRIARYKRDAGKLPKALENPHLGLGAQLYSLTPGWACLLPPSSSLRLPQKPSGEFPSWRSGTMRLWVQSLALLSGFRIRRCREL